MKTELRSFPGMFRLRACPGDTFASSLLSRYNLLHETEVIEQSDSAVSDGSFSLRMENGEAVLTGTKREVRFSLQAGRGFTITVPITPGERFFGLGDETREMLMKRGHTAHMWIKNVVAYGPMPFLMSSDGWAIFVNCTYRHSFDIGDSDPNTLRIHAAEGPLDIYLFCADSFQGLIAAYTSLSGRPPILPKFAYGYLYVCNEQTDARSLLWDCRTFRKEKIPCDTMGLEPSWMTTRYDFSLDKNWNKDLFYLPHWLPDNQNGTFTFFFALREMGFRFSLWLCQDYDLLFKEERDAAAALPEGADEAEYEGAEIVDEHFASGIRMDKITRPEEPWFEHLKKFVDNGASAFKLDGSAQIIEHPDRLWAGRYFDREVHNLYPVLYARQMSEGFEEYTGRRSMIYTAGQFAGIQAYAATWAGDTGGGPKSILSILNFAMCGHTNASCDIQVTDLAGIHTGFLLPWVQQLGWANWQYPWFLRESLEEGIRYYAQLRSSLFPYLYSMAYLAHAQGLPILRPLPLVYEDTDRFDQTKNLYFLGDSLLVGFYDMDLDLPDGSWIDFWTEKSVSGSLTYTPPEGRGGALLVKEGAIIPMMAPQPYIEKCIPDPLLIHWYPREGAKAHFTLYEDDGSSLAYRDGVCALTEIDGSMENGCARLTIGKRCNNGVDAAHLVSNIQLIVHPDSPTAEISIAGEKIVSTVDRNLRSFAVPGALDEEVTVCVTL